MDTNKDLEVQNEEVGTSKTYEKEVKRGATIMQRVIKARSSGIKFEVGWNESGQPVDPNSSMFVSYIGAVVRQNVPITIDNWRDKALKDAKDIIWNDIQTTFVLDEERKSYVLRVAGKIHRGFRSHLSNFYLKDREGNTNAEPPKIYQHYISKDEWSAFVSKRSDPAFVNISTANRERASNPKHPYKKSRMGYARLEQKIRKDTQADQPLGRHILWKEARVNKEGVVDNENVKKVVELCETIEQSSETQEGNKDTCRDILGKVFNVPEYSGRVRGKGFGVTPKSFFPQEKRQKPSNEEVLEKLRILSEQVALLVNTNKDKQLPVQLQPEIQMESETGSCNVGLKTSFNPNSAKSNSASPQIQVGIVDSSTPVSALMAVPEILYNPA
ncbi:uncharacterized protein [Cicer arietinum]|uniref:uncharacterized protein n=1 Tax=Cicer arietinum TaxID=3827 RepID=UPI003CC5D943